MRSWIAVFGILFPAMAVASPALVLPAVSTGSVPYQHFSGALCDTPTTLLTVDPDKEFLVTMAVTDTDSQTSQGGDWEDHYGAMLMVDGVPVLAGQTIGEKATIPVSRGFGKLPVPGGSTLSIKTTHYTGCNRHYYLQGHYIEPGSPYRSFFGNSNISRDVITAAAGQVFLVRTIATSSRDAPSHCHVWIDGSKVIHGNTWTTTDRNYWGSGSAGGFASGQGTMVLTEGMTLQVGPDDPTLETQCDYYVAGEYIHP